MATEILVFDFELFIGDRRALGQTFFLFWLFYILPKTGIEGTVLHLLDCPHVAALGNRIAGERADSVCNHQPFIRFR